ncbi:hypothetical protein [Photobacterium indicum]|uniref:Uncharacterized protein n=1 Tax=Photobacterium indicum TaxID=81447 RepID=A0A2T3L8I8_9GAMM|nr:hypothetical protein [Photobacterium indicum]PSV47299.1 hypothetical protein C9J47_10485 [Photobacterium indicum]
MKHLRNVFITLVVILFSTAATAATAKWLTTDNTDAITGERTVSAFYYQYKLEKNIGIRCDVNGGDKDIMLTFDTDSALATPRSNVEVFIKVDDNAPVKLSGSLYTNSYRSGYVNDSTKNNLSKIFAQMIAGNNAYIKIQNDRRSEVVNFKVNLSGFTSKSKKALSACDFNPKSKSMTKDDKDRLVKIDAEIRKLQTEKTTIKAKY